MVVYRLKPVMNAIRHKEYAGMRMKDRQELALTRVAGRRNVG
jgi:hypothetical protein